MIDILSYLSPPQEFWWNSHLVDPITKQPQYTVASPTGIWYPKNDPPALLGFDYNPYDTQYVYQKLTELDWKAGNFKAFLGKGVPWCPRFYDPSMRLPPIIIPDTSYVAVTNGVKGPVQNLKVGVTQLSGPMYDDFNGDVGQQQFVRVTWQWDNGAVMESFDYCGPYTFGWTRWQAANLQPDGTYKVMQTSLFNTIAKGGFGPISFPYPIP